MNKKIEYRETDSLKFADFNPSNRTSERYIGDIVKSMNEDGFWDWNPVHITPDGVVADGNRRLAAARAVGIRRIPVIVVDGNVSAGEIWGKINSRKNVRAIDMLEAHSKGLSIEYIRSHRKTILRLMDVGGEELVEHIQKSGYSPTIINDAGRLAFRAGRSRDNEFIKKTIYWMIKWKMNDVLHFVLAHGGDITKIEDYILSDSPVNVFMSL